VTLGANYGVSYRRTLQSETILQSIKLPELDLKTSHIAVFADTKANTEAVKACGDIFKCDVFQQ
jgi:ribosomal protein L1